MTTAGHDRGTRSIVRLKHCLPWWMKIAIKIAIARIPVRYGTWKRLHIFEHGRMEDVDYLYGTVLDHIAACPKPVEGCHLLELGPGDSASTALVTAALGAARTTLVDVGSFADSSIDLYRRTACALRQRFGLRVPNVEHCATMDQFLAGCRAEYLTNGVASLKALPTQSIDFAWSNAVLEHVRRETVPELLLQLRRIMRPDGLISHQVDLRDHLNGQLNNLRFAQRLWESTFMFESGFYTNRLRLSEWLHLFREQGFTIVRVDEERWPALPVKRRQLHEHFRSLTDAELMVSGFRVILRA